MRLQKLGASVTLISVEGVSVLFSYETPVAAFIEGKGYVRTAKDWSRTTNKHITQWAGMKVEAEKPQSFFDNLLTAKANI